MAVSTAYAPLEYAGNDVTTAFSVTWPFFTGTLVVTAIDDDGVETVKTITTHYTVSGGTDANGLPATGTVTMLTAPATGTQLRIERSTPKTQAAVYTENDAFPAKTHEAALDKLTLLHQEGIAAGFDEITGDFLQLNSAGATDFWDAEDHKIRNVIDGTEDDDAVTKSQMEAALAESTIGDTAFVQAGAGAVSRTWQSKMRDAVDARDFGYVADWTSAGETADTATDNTTALQAAIDYMAESFAGGADVGGGFGGVVLLPKGTGMIGSLITLKDGVVLKGQGPMASVLKMKDTFSASSHFIRMGNSSDLASFQTRLEDLQLFATPINATSGKAMVYSDNIQHTGGLCRVKIFAGNRHSVFLETGDGGASYFTFEDVEAFNHTESGVTSVNSNIKLDYAGLLTSIRNLVVQQPASQDAASKGLEILGGFVIGNTIHFEVGTVSGVYINIPNVNSGAVSLKNVNGSTGITNVVHIAAATDRGTVRLEQIMSNGSTNAIKDDVTTTNWTGDIILPWNQWTAYTDLTGHLTHNATMDIGGVLTLGNTGLHLQDTNGSHDLIIKPGSDLSGGDRTLTLTTGNADRTLTLDADVQITTFGAALVDDANAEAARGTLSLATSTVDNAACRFDGGAGVTQNSPLVIADTTGALSRTGGGGIPVQGTNTNDSAAAGDVGQYISGSLAIASAISLTNNTAADVVSISLTAGDWDIGGVAPFQYGGGTVTTQIKIGVSTTTATMPDNDAGQMSAGAWGAGKTGGSADFLPLPAGIRLSLSGTTTVYLVALALFTTSTCSVSGQIWARRVR